MQDLANKTPGSQLTADEWNELATEVQTIITNAGIVLSGSDLTQVAKGLAKTIGSGTFYTDSGAANAYVLTNIDTLQRPIVSSNGLEIRFIPTNTNTGASVVNVATLGDKDLTNSAGAALVPGDLTAGIAVVAYYNLGSDHYRIVSTVSSLQTVIKSADQNYAGNLTVNDTGLTFTAVASTRYHIKGFVKFTGVIAPSSGNYSVSFVWPSSVDSSVQIVFPSTTVHAGGGIVSIQGSGGTGFGFATSIGQSDPTLTDTDIFTFEFLLITDVTGGTFNLAFNASTDGDFNVNKESYLEIRVV